MAPPSKEPLSRNALRAESTLSMERNKIKVEQEEREKHNPRLSIADSFEQKGGKAALNDDTDETRSQMSLAVDNIVGGAGADPRKTKAT